MTDLSPASASTALRGSPRVDSSTGGYLTPTSAPPPEDYDLDAILQSVVVGCTGLPANLVRPRFQLIPPAQPENTTSWCAIGVVDEVPDSNIISRHDGSADGSTKTQTTVTVQVMASFYGPAARGNAALLRDGLMVAQNREALQLQGIALMEMPGAIRFLGEISNQQTIRWADVSFRLRVPYTRVWAILNLLSAQGEILTDVGESDDILVTDPMPE